MRGRKVCPRPRTVSISGVRATPKAGSRQGAAGLCRTRADAGLPEGSRLVASASRKKSDTCPKNGRTRGADTTRDPDPRSSISCRVPLDRPCLQLGQVRTRLSAEVFTCFSLHIQGPP